MNTTETESDINLLWVAVLVEGVLILLAILLSLLGLYDDTQPISLLSETPLLPTFAYGVISTIPLLCYLAVFHFWHPKFYEPMRQFADESLRPMFAGAGLIELLVISTMAGVGEEMFFRWCLQGGATHFLSVWMPPTTAFVVSLLLISALFGICHWVNGFYLIAATVAGVYFGLVMWWTGSWLVAAMGHALFDFAALVYLQRIPSRPRLI